MKDYLICALAAVILTLLIGGSLWIKVWSCQNLHPGAGSLACLVSR